MTTTVVNIRKRKGKPHQKCDVLIDRRTIFGNPHPIGQCNICNRVHDRKDSIAEYKKYFYKRLTDLKFRDKVLELKGKRLGCWCVPLACHGNIIKEYLDNNLEKEETDL